MIYVLMTNTAIRSPATGARFLSRYQDAGFLTYAFHAGTMELYDPPIRDLFAA